MDHIAPTDDELRSMTDEEILGPPEGATVGELEALGIGPGDEDIVDMFDVESNCYIDLKQRRMIHGRRCRCIKPSEVAADSAHEA